ncbi:NAD(P)-binding domain protein [Moelleriella libera RCEF 2490]|uniref:NAD(P)-binding domain protein n=1 Tax=Moelleriella libera RCEF 2490 TaxID=1081109 RepID=A0A167VI08_9HYPO|nr:NAD(P)-binding domain protein [Moelleriella libera RCEF 2490]
MDDKSEILASSEQFARQQSSGRVAVFMGATAGIGESTLGQMVTMLNDSVFYTLGRNPEHISGKLDQLSATAAKRGNIIIFVESQVSSIASIDAACDRIRAAESKVDYLCMSPGGMPFGGATSVVNHTTICTSLAFDYLAELGEVQNAVFLHATPGYVSTDTPRKTHPTMDSGLLWWAFISVMQIVSGCIIYYFGMNVLESGQRHAYYLTSDAFQPGSWQINKHSVTVPPNRVLKKYQDEGLADRVWEHTLCTWNKALNPHGSE